MSKIQRPELQEQKRRNLTVNAINPCINPHNLAIFRVAASLMRFSAWFALQIENQISTYDPDGYIVVFAVDDESTLSAADRILAYLKSEDIVQNHAVILVANKTDLVRSRAVSTNGKGMFIFYVINRRGEGVSQMITNDDQRGWGLRN